MLANALSLTTMFNYLYKYLFDVDRQIRLQCIAKKSLEHALFLRFLKNQILF